MSAPVDVLAVLDELIDFEERHAEYEPRQNHEAREVRTAVAELIEAATLVSAAAVIHYGDGMGLHIALTGAGGLNERLSAALARVKGETE